MVAARAGLFSDRQHLLPHRFYRQLRTTLMVALACNSPISFAAQPSIAARPIQEPLVIAHRRFVTSASAESIQTVLDNLPNDNRWAMITLGPGVFQQQLFIRRGKTILSGSGKEQTVLRFGILREHFLKSKQTDKSETNSAALPRADALEQDWGAAVINIAASDIVLLDMTVQNSYALEHPTDPRRFSHQFAVRGFQNATRILTDHVNFASNGADTVSFWNKTNGMYYHANGRFTGRVDLMCPRGTAYITHSEFVTLQAVATLWHDGELSPQHKLVVSHSRFLGVHGFELGRHHYDGQFYLLHNRFSKVMADAPIYRRTYPQEPWRDQPNRYGQRYYFFANQLDDGSQYPWFHDNLSSDQARHISADWTFQNAWHPEMVLSQIRQSLHH